VWFKANRSDRERVRLGSYASDKKRSLEGLTTKFAFSQRSR
jgi:hypothetical protein